MKKLLLLSAMVACVSSFHAYESFALSVGDRTANWQVSADKNSATFVGKAELGTGETTSALPNRARGCNLLGRAIAESRPAANLSNDATVQSSAM